MEQFDLNDELFFDVSDPIDYVGGDLDIYIEFLPMSSQTGKSVQWEIVYKAQAYGAVITGTTGTLDSGDIPLATTQYTAQTLTVTIPQAALAGAHAIYFKVIRVALDAGSDPSAGPAIVNCNVRYNSTR